MRDRRVEPVERADVLAAQVDVDERRDPAVGEDLGAECRMPFDEVVEHLAHRRAGRLDLTRAADVAAQRGGNPDDGHAWTPGVPWQNST